MLSNERKEAEEQIRQLETMLEDLRGISLAPPSSPEEVLRLLEVGMARTRGYSTWLAKAERQIWRITSPIWDMRLRRQIRMVRELTATAGLGTEITADAIRHLDDLVFARTYGRMVEGPVKRVVRNIASKGEMATHELRNLVINRCFRIDKVGCVKLPVEPWLLPLGIFQFIFATLVAIPYLLLILMSNAGIGRQLLGVTLFAVPYLLACWNIRRHFIDPHRLIPRAQRLLPRPQIASV